MSLDRIKQALTRKIGPAPAWAWVALVAGALVLWKRYRDAHAPATAQTAPPAGADTYQPAPLLGSGGGGSGPSLQPPQDLQPSQTPVVYDPLTDSYASEQPAPTEPAPASTSDTTTAESGTPTRGHLSQPLNPNGKLQPLRWGGQLFFTQSAFDAWARQHGTTSARIFVNHPEAQRIYLQLAPGAGVGRARIDTGAPSRPAAKQQRGKPVKTAPAASAGGGTRTRTLAVVTTPPPPAPKAAAPVVAPATIAPTGKAVIPSEAPRPRAPVAAAPAASKPRAETAPKATPQVATGKEIVKPGQVLIA